MNVLLHSPIFWLGLIAGFGFIMIILPRMLGRGAWDPQEHPFVRWLSEPWDSSVDLLHRRVKNRVQK